MIVGVSELHIHDHFALMALSLAVIPESFFEPSEHILLFLLRSLGGQSKLAPLPFRQLIFHIVNKDRSMEKEIDHSML